MIPKPLVKQVLDRDEHECVLGLPGCLRTATVADHRANRGMGGSRALDAPQNLVAACWPCNGRKEDSSGEERAILIERGLIVLHDSSTSKTLHRALQTHVVDWRGRFWFLLPDGSRQGCYAPEW